MLIESIYKQGNNLLQNITNKINQKLFPYGENIIFILGAAIYLSARVYFIVALIINSPAIPGGDDAYTYLVSSAEVKTCFSQECQALEDLREQVMVPIDDVTIAKDRGRQFQRIISFYHPLYSLILSGLESILSSPEAAYKVLVVSGAILLNLVVCYLLYTAWGPAGAGIALGMLAFTLHSGSSFYDIDPSDLSTGVAFLSWGLILKNSKHKDWGIPTLIFFMCAIHNIGQIYGVVALVLYLLLSKLPLKKNALWSAGVSILILAIFFFVIPLVRKPDMSLFNPGWFYTGTVNKTETLNETIKILVQDLSWWGTSVYSKITALGLIVIGFIGVSEKRRLKVLSLSLLLLGLAVTSIFYIIPWFPALLTNRVWIPLKIFLFGAIGTAIWLSLKAIIQHFSITFNSKEKIKKIDFNTLLLFINKGEVLIFLLVFFFIGSTYLQNQWLNGYQYKNHMDNVERLSNTFWFDPTQPALLLSQISEQDSILYMQEMTLYYFLSHGTLDSHLVYYPSVFNTPLQKAWIDDNENLKYLVALNPLKDLSPASSGAIPFSECVQLIIDSEKTFSLSTVELQLSNRGNKEESISFTYSSEEKIKQKKHITVPPKTTGWFSISNNKDIFVDGFSILCKKQENISLEGMHLFEDDGLNWPWDQGIVLKLRSTTNPTEELISIAFSSEILDEELDLPLKIIADDGVTILVEISP